MSNNWQHRFTLVLAGFIVVRSGLLTILIWDGLIEPQLLSIVDKARVVDDNSPPLSTYVVMGNPRLLWN